MRRFRGQRVRDASPSKPLVFPFLVACLPSSPLECSYLSGSRFTFDIPLIGSIFRFAVLATFIFPAEVSVKRSRQRRHLCNRTRMARYQLRRPSFAMVIPKRVRRQTPISSMVPADEGMEDPESPSMLGDDSDSEDSEPEDEGGDAYPIAKNASSARSSILQPSSMARVAAALGTVSATRTPSQTLLSIPTSKVYGTSASTPPPKPASAQPSSYKGTLAAGPQSNNTGSATTASTRQTPTTTVVVAFSSKIPRPDPAATSSGAYISPLMPPSALPETTGEQDPPRISFPQGEHHTLISKGGAAAAITLSILGGSLSPSYLPPPSQLTHNVGALAIVLASVIFFKRRKRQNQHRQRLGDDAFDPSNTGSLRAPETAHVGPDPSFLTGSHLTHSTKRSDFLFGGGSYIRPETVSTAHDTSYAPYATNSIAPPMPTSNPFADPPLNKAYDVLAGRPRSTTLTDRGSWVKNPFKNPESERFDPFGELKDKARRKRKRHLKEARREADMRRNEEFATKEKMGLAPPQGVHRKGSGVTLEAVRVLDRSGAGAYQ
jgi:hypothetical protein